MALNRSTPGPPPLVEVHWSNFRTLLYGEKMAKIANRLLASALAVVALYFFARAAALFWVMASGPHNFVPVPKTPDGCQVCPPQVFLTDETEQILILLGSSIVIAMAWMIWQRSSSAQR
jgi:hypothetical protein